MNSLAMLSHFKIYLWDNNRCVLLFFFTNIYLATNSNYCFKTADDMSLAVNILNQWFFEC